MFPRRGWYSEFSRENEIFDRRDAGISMTSLNRIHFVCLSALTVAVLLSSNNALARARTPPSDIEANAAYAVAHPSEPALRCLDHMRGLSGSTDAVTGQLMRLNVSNKIPLDEYISNYGNLCPVRAMAENAQRRGMGRKADYLCYRRVKEFINLEAPWLTAKPINGGSAYMAKEQLKQQGLIDILPSHPEFANDPSLVPPGAIVVYARNDSSCPRWMPGFICRVSDNGDVQIRTPDGFYSGFFSPNPMILQPAGPLMKVSAVMIKPMRVTSFNKARQCFEAVPLN